MHNILIADDHAAVRAGLRQFLVDSGLVCEVAEAATGEQAMDFLRDQQCHLLILDINMPGRGGLDILKHVRASFPATKVLVVSGFPERQYAVPALKAGACRWTEDRGLAISFCLYGCSEHLNIL